MELTGVWQIVVKFSVAICITPAIGGIDYQDGKRFKGQNYTLEFIKAIVDEKKLCMSAIFFQKETFFTFMTFFSKKRNHLKAWENKNKKTAANRIATAFYSL
jgi:hypothetical protein